MVLHQPQKQPTQPGGVLERLVCNFTDSSVWFVAFVKRSPRSGLANEKLSLLLIVLAFISLSLKLAETPAAEEKPPRELAKVCVVKYVL